MANGEWRMANGEWRLANGDWRMAISKWLVRFRGRWRTLAALAVALIGCDAPNDAPRHVVSRDSAGTEIVENPASQYVDTLQWIVDSLPIAEIGGPDATGEYELGEVAGVTRLGDGRIAVLDRDNNELRFFSANGRFHSKVGRRGDGPGEFDSPSRLFRGAGDTLTVLDRFDSRANVFSATGSFVRTYEIQTPKRETFRPRRFADQVALFGDGSFLERQSELNCVDFKVGGDGSISGNAMLKANCADSC